MTRPLLFITLSLVIFTGALQRNIHAQDTPGIAVAGLRPGNHYLMAEASNNEDDLPFLRTHWFVPLAVVLILCVIYVAIRMRTNMIKRRTARLEQLVEERTEELKKANENLLQEITERKELQEKLLYRGKMAALGELASAVGHDLRNPLGVIKNSIYFLNMVLEKSEPEVKETLNLLEEEALNSENIIESLLDFARAKPPLGRRVNIEDVIREALSNITIPENIKVKTRFDESLPVIMADPNQIDQALTNIVLNAIQAMPAGGQLIVMSQLEDEKWLLISVIDTGKGIPEENIEKVFEPLFSGKAKGVGLGLAVAQTFIAAHGGRIDVDSEVGKGSTFKIKLPTGKRTGREHTGKDDRDHHPINESSQPIRKKEEK